jgi:hypothetical protein
MAHLLLPLGLIQGGTMAHKALATYLNDHLSGSVIALELMEYLEQAHGDAPIASFLAELRAEVAADRDELERIIERLDIRESLPRQAAAWFAEKIARLKLQLDAGAAAPMGLFEGLEVLSLGIEGKRMLWQALSAVAAGEPALQGFDYERLQRRAVEQRRRVEAERLAVAGAALAKNSQAREER